MNCKHCRIFKGPAHEIERELSEWLQDEAASPAFFVGTILQSAVVYSADSEDGEMAHVIITLFYGYKFIPPHTLKV